MLNASPPLQLLLEPVEKETNIEHKYIVVIEPPAMSIKCFLLEELRHKVSKTLGGTWYEKQRNATVRTETISENSFLH